MNASEYQTCAERTMIDPNNEHRMVNAALGLCGEAGEVSTSALSTWSPRPDDLLIECGDCLWYVAQMCKALDISIASLSTECSDLQEMHTTQATRVLYGSCARIADTVKKYVFHQRAFDRVEITVPLESVCAVLRYILEGRGYSLGQAFDANNQKLLKRHPNGFSAATANARADEL